MSELPNATSFWHGDQHGYGIPAFDGYVDVAHTVQPDDLVGGGNTTWKDYNSTYGESYELPTRNGHVHEIGDQTIQIAHKGVIYDTLVSSQL